VSLICGKTVFRTKSGQQYADVRRPGHRIAGHDRAAGGRRGLRAGPETRPAKGRASAVQAGHAGGALQAAVHQHEAPEERVQDRRRFVVTVRSGRRDVERRRRCRRRSPRRRRSRRTRVGGQR